MNVEFPRGVRERVGFGRLTPRVAAGALAATQAADLLVTLVALRFVPGVREANVVAAAAIASFGPAVGLTAVAAVAVGGLILVTERAASFVGSHPDGSPEAVTAVRLVGYGPMTALNVVVVVHNALLIASVHRPG
ncbi:hypothetical protein [Halorarum salinum]|uniref:DUF5658 domain-containing protein n=1 Tax=Halorarum salinum TaxID=2743089 RepID=A0A7D5QK95_9EURY|nr:hypothetical protein [Halobaculum salinum]QLG64304.1 hypothetical protein HUG12_21225 [Halobaculum salinum]